MNLNSHTLSFNPIGDSTIPCEIAALPPLVSPDLSLQEAIALMSQSPRTCDLSPENDREFAEARSCVLAIADERLVGILTERDIVRQVAIQPNLEGQTVAEAMTANPITLQRSQLSDIFAVLNIFRASRFRHLPITDENGNLLGIVTPTSLRQRLQPIDLLRMRSVAEVMQHRVVTADPQASLLTVARLLGEQQISCAVIVESASDGSLRPLGIVTERDIVQFQALELNFATATAAQAMSAPLFGLPPEQTLWDAHEAMQRRRIRRLVVTGDRGELLGLITQTHILQALDPMELYKTVEILQSRVNALETEKVELLQTYNSELEVQVQERTLQLTQQAQGDRVLAKIAQRIQLCLELPEFLNPTLVEIQHYLQADRVVIYQFHPDWQGTVIAEARSPAATSLLGYTIHDPCFAPTWIEPYCNQRISTIADVETAPLTECHRQLLQRHHIRANVVVPILSGTQLWGLLCVQQCDRPRIWQASECELLKQLSTQLGIAIDKAQLYHKVNTELRDRVAAETALKQLNEELERRVAARTAELEATNTALKAEIAERQRAEAEVRRSERHLRDVLNALFTFVGVMTPDGLLTEINHASLAVTQSKPEDVLGKPLVDAPWWLDDPEWRSRAEAAIARGARGESSRYDVPIQLPSGDLMMLDFSIQPIFDESGQVSHLVASANDITARHKAQDTLQKQLTAIEAAIDGIAILEDNRYVYLNEAHATLFGYETMDELLGKPWQLLYSEAELARFGSEIFPILGAQGHWYGEAIATRKDGSTFIEALSLTLTGEKGLVCVCRDITEQKRIEAERQQLFKELSDFKYALDQAAIVAITDPQGRITYANDNFCAISQYSREELLGQTHQLVNSGEHDREFFEQMWQTLTQGEVWRGEIQNTAKDGSFYWVDTTIVPFLDCQGKPYQYLAIRNDISDRKAAEMARRESEIKFRQMAENIQQVFWMTGVDQQYMIYVSPAYETIWGRSRQSLYDNPRSFLEAVHVEDRDRLLAAMSQKVNGFDVEYRILRPDGTLRWIRDRAFPLQDEQGVVYRVTGIAEDISDRKHAEMALQDSQQFLRSVIDTNPNPIFVKDTDSRFVLVNNAIATLFNTSVEALIGKTEADFSGNSDEVKQYLEDDRRVIQELQPIFIPEETFTTTTGDVRYFQTIKTPLISNNGTVQVLGVATDITERKRAEQEMAKALQREKELSNLKSRFVSMTSHEFRTPLAVISSSAGILKTFAHKLKEDQKQKHLDTIQTYIKHTTQLLDDILLIQKVEAGKLAYNPEPLAVVEFCCQLISELQISAPQHHLECEIDAPASLVAEFDKKLLRQILTNLLSNAIKYSPDDSTITLTLNWISDNLIFQVQDCGIGIPPEDIKHLFESFHRATNVGNRPGTGLGLSIVQKCVDLHGGQITVESELGVGTTVSVTFPLPCH
jgi:PAS domain S-box-containing protein